MRHFRDKGHLTRWIAMLAVLLAALVPTVSHAIAAAQGASWAGICTAQGPKSFQAGPQDPSNAPIVGHALEHCAYCSIHAPVLGVPAVAPSAPPAFDQEAVPLRVLLAAPRTLHPWSSPQPRAPPSIS
jgi:hypothetical protein